MTGLADLRRRQDRLQDIRGLMTAMKSLALVETRKLARVIAHQRAMRANIEAAAADFLAFHPALAGTPAPGMRALLVLVGAERGFCGGFDEQLLHRLDAAPPALREASLVLVGQRLGARLPGTPRIAARLDGATVAEDVPGVLDRLIDALRGLQPGGAPTALAVLAHDEAGEPALTQLLPLPHPGEQAPRGHAPLLDLAPPEFFAGLLDQWLLAALVGLLYASLAAESHQRLAHMEQAIDRLDDTLQRLALRRNALRQERIVEEIEVMLASAMATAARVERVGAASGSGARP